MKDISEEKKSVYELYQDTFIITIYDTKSKYNFNIDRSSLLFYPHYRHPGQTLTKSTTQG